MASNNRAAILDTKARVAAALDTANRLQRSGDVDESIAVALYVAAESLKWLGEYSMYDEQDRRDIPLVELMSANLLSAYVALSEDLQTVLEGIALDSASPVLAELVDSVLTRISSLLQDMAQLLPQGSELRSAVEQKYVGTRTTLVSYGLWVRTRGAVEKAEEAADSAAESAGATAEHSLSEQFEELAEAESTAANLFRGLTIALFVAVISFTAYIAFGETAEPATEIFQKLALGIPVLLLAAYFGREANQHRRTARWATVLVAQLKSIRAYSIELPDNSRTALKAAFGQRVFLESPETAASGVESDSSLTALDVASVLREAADLARASRGTS